MAGMKTARTLLLGAGVLSLSLGLAALGLWLMRGEFVERSVPGLAPDQVFDRASRSVVTVYAAETSGKIVGRGSGVFVEGDLLVTTCHVIARGHVYLVGHRQKRSRARLVAVDAERDLCALHVQGLDAVPAHMGSAEPLRVGQRVYAIGAPEGLELTLSEGLVSGLREAAAGRYVQITAALSEGSSGGGLFDESASLVGITAFVYSTGQNLNFAAPADWAADLVRKVARAADAAPVEVEMPPALKKRWRHPVLK